MKNRLFLFLLTTLVAYSCYAQMVGSWKGLLKISQQYSLTLVIHITDKNGHLSATLDSPDQQQFGIPVSEVRCEGNKLMFRSDDINATYEGTLDHDTIHGIFVQNAIPLVLDLTHQKPSIEKGLVYIEEEVKIVNSVDGVVLSGTVTRPYEGTKFPAVVLVAGSGPNNRDSDLFGHHPLLDIADYLTKHGIAVLRYDKRGVGESTGVFSASSINDFATDARMALEWLRQQPYVVKAGLLGHSEGGLVAQMVAAEFPKLTDYIILLAAPGVSGLETIVFQNVAMIGGFLKEGSEKKFEEITRTTFQQIQSDLSTRQADSLILRDYNKKVELLIAEDKRPILKDFFQNEKRFLATLNSVTTPFYKVFLRNDPKDYLPRITCPILALNGIKDMQVEAQTNLDAIKSNAISSQLVVTKSYDDLNHLFIPSVTGLPNEYPMLKEPFSIDVLRDITLFIKEFM